MNTITHKDPLHGKTLEAILRFLLDHFGWEELSKRIKIQCFISKPTIKSSLTFLRKTPWARTKVENLYLTSIGAEKGQSSPEALKIFE